MERFGPGGVSPGMDQPNMERPPPGMPGNMKGDNMVSSWKYEKVHSS